MGRHVSINPYTITDGQLSTGTGGRMQRCLRPKKETFSLTSSFFSILGENPDQKPYDCALYLVNINRKPDASESYKDKPLVDKASIYCGACMPGFSPTL